MQTSFQETIGTALHQSIHQKQHPEVVTFLKLTSIKGMLGVVEQIYRLLDHNTVELTEGITLKVGKKLQIELNRKAEEIDFSFRPAPEIKAKVAGLMNVRAGLTGILLQRREMKLLLDGLPDVRIGLE